jgi:hypothetical protein
VLQLYLSQGAASKDFFTPDGEPWLEHNEGLKLEVLVEARDQLAKSVSGGQLLSPRQPLIDY